jgi:hypothetical protein
MFRLTGNLTISDPNTSAIQIGIDDVTIDLNGFSIVGPTGFDGPPVTSCDPVGTGIGISGPDHVHVMNEMIRGMGAQAISLTWNARIERVEVHFNAARPRAAAIPEARALDVRNACAGLSTRPAARAGSAAPGQASSRACISSTSAAPT